MKNKIVIDLHVNNECCRAKAMEIAVKCSGVISVTFNKEKGHLEVTGAEVDAFKLIKSLKKKFTFASVQEVKPALVTPAKKKDETKEEKVKLPCCPPPTIQTIMYVPYCYDDPCSIL